MKIDFKNYLNRLHPEVAYGVTFFTYWLTPFFSNIYCNPKTFIHFENGVTGAWNEKAYYAYQDSLEGYCDYYDNIYMGFFSYGDNTFYELFTFSLIIVFASMLLELFFHLFDRNIDHEELSKENRTLKKYFIERLIQIPVVYFCVMFVGG